ncbi:MAG: hypothetical protein WKF80_04980 [Thermomicrobiales bacterium]
MDETDYGLAPGESYAPEDRDERFDLSRAHVMTVLGPVDPGALGPTLTHEHLLRRPSGDPTAIDLDIVLDDPYRTLTALENYAESAGGAIVDMTVAGSGRDAGGLLWLARRSPVHVIAATGYDRASPSWVKSADRDDEAIAGQWVRELSVGIGETGVRPGVLWVGMGPDPFGGGEDRMIRAAARAHLATGVPLAIGGDRATESHDPLSILTVAGVPADRVIIGHLDRSGDQAAALDAMARGAYGAVDQIGQGDADDDARRADLVSALVGAGHGERVLLSHGLGRRSLIPAYGGAPGWSHIAERFVLMLMGRGLPAAIVHRLLVTNPQSALTIRRPA